MWLGVQEQEQRFTVCGERPTLPGRCVVMDLRHHSRRTVIVLVVLIELATPLSALVRPARASAATSPATLNALTALGTLGG